MGDPAGIGPEIILQTINKRAVKKNYHLLVIGDSHILEQSAKNLGIACKIYAPPSFDKIKEEYLNVLDLDNIEIGQVTIGQATAPCGRASIEYIEKAIELCQKGVIQAMVTAPINKEAINLAGFHYPGHTELLARKTNTINYAMMLAGAKLRVVLVTTHLAISDVPSSITQENVYRIIKLTHKWLNTFHPQQTTIAVCGLNPHAGENNLFGNEEINAIIPAILQAKEKNIPIEGPFPSDSLFYRAQKGTYGAVVCMYHDQGLIPLKMLAFDTGVNITLGLPIIRTSVDHGTAYNIAWQGKASSSSLKAAIEYAAYLTKKKG